MPLKTAFPRSSFSSVTNQVAASWFISICWQIFISRLLLDGWISDSRARWGWGWGVPVASAVVFAGTLGGVGIIHLIRGSLVGARDRAGVRGYALMVAYGVARVTVLRYARVEGIAIRGRVGCGVARKWLTVRVWIDHH